MSLETSKKVLKIAGILSIITAVFSLLMTILAVVASGTVLSDPTIESSTELQEQAGYTIVGVIIFGIIGIISLIEGIVSLRAAKTGKKSLATLAMIFACLSTISEVSNLFRNGNNASAIVNSVVSIAINVLVAYAAYVVRQNAEA